jgi:hypothetical protein
MVRVEWSNRSIYTSYDMPAYIYLDTEGDTVRLKVYEEYEGGTAIYIDDTATRTNRRGQLLIKIWDTNVHGTPPTTPAIYEVTVEIYDTANRLRSARKLRYKYVRSNTVLFFRSPDGRSLVGIINYVDTQGFFIHAYGSSISLYYEGEAYIEFLRQESKHYYIGKLKRVVGTPGAYNVIIYPSRDGYIHFYIDIKIDNELLRWIFNTPVISEFAGFIAQISLNIHGLSLYVASKILERAGLSDIVINKVEVVSTSPLTIRIHASQDPKPLLKAVAVVGLLAFGLLAGLIAGGYIVDIVYSFERVVALKVTEQIYTQYSNLVAMIIDYCKNTYSGNNEMINKCIDELLSKITLPTVTAINAVVDIQKIQEEIKKLRDEINMWKTLVIVAAIIIVALIIAQRQAVVVAG